MAIRGLEIEPLVRWPRRMTPGQAYLVEVDLRLGSDFGWPYEEEEFAFTFLLDGGPKITIDALGESTVVLHRFGGTYGPARFVATAEDATGDQALWLSLLTQRGILARTDKLAVTIRSPAEKSDEDSAALSDFTRRVLSTAMQPDARVHYFMVKLEPGGPRQDHYFITIWSQQDQEYPVPLVMDDQPRYLADVPGMLGPALGSLTRRLNGAEISVEFILPRSLLSHPVDQWNVTGVPLGVEYPVVVRSLERIGSRRLYPLWQERWQQLHAPQPPRDSEKVTVTSDQDDSPRDRLLRDPGVCCLLFARADSAPWLPADRATLDAAVEAGIPAILWPRRDPGSDFPYRLLRMIDDRGIGRLPSIVREFRAQEFAGDVQAELSLLWDDPGRLPYEPERFLAPR